MTDVKVWFVTGASSGFGHAMTEHLLKVGNKVVATLRNPEAISDLSTRYPSTQLLVVKVDVTNKADVTAAFAKAEEVFGRIDVVFNNAGARILGEVESVNEVEAREMFDVNFWGAVRVSTEAVRFFREVNKPMGGRLLQMSSGLGLKGPAVCGHYSASKFGKSPVISHPSGGVMVMQLVLALEGLSESLVAELDPAWNIKVTILEPGPYRTEIFKRNYRITPEHNAYGDPALISSKTRKLLDAPKMYDGDVTKAAIAIEKLTRLEDAPIRFPLHWRVVTLTRDKAKSMLEVVDKYESWTDDLYHRD